MREANDHEHSISDTTREKILEAARLEFAELGLAGARVDRIAEHAGVNKAMIYYHFKSKDELYGCVIDEFQQRAMSLIRQDLSASFTFEEFLRAAVERHATLIGNRPDVRSILMRELANPDRQFLDRMTKNILGSGLPQDVIVRLRNSMETGEFRRFDPRQIMTAFLTLSIGFYFLEPLFATMGPLTDRDAFIEERKKVIVDLLLNGLRAKPA